MVIDKIGNINKVVGSEKVRQNKAQDTKVTQGQDTVSISKEAQQAQEMSKVVSTVRQTPDVRADRVKEVKAKMANGDYDNPGSELLDKVAEKIAEALVRT